MRNLKLLHSHTLVFALHVFMLIGLEQLTLCRLMLLILLLEVAQLAVELVQCVFKVLNLCYSVCCFVGRARNRVLILLE